MGMVAEALLRETDWQVARIAKEARFTSAGVFCRFFRRRYGCSPEEWRWKR
jgi:AraC-like DNA-binding protein